MSSIQSKKEARSRILRYSEEILRLTPPKDISEEVLLQVYELLVENYWKEKNDRLTDTGQIEGINIVSGFHQHM